MYTHGRNDSGSVLINGSDVVRAARGVPDKITNEKAALLELSSWGEKDDDRS